MIDTSRITANYHAKECESFLYTQQKMNNLFKFNVEPILFMQSC